VATDPAGLDARESVFLESGQAVPPRGLSKALDPSKAFVVANVHLALGACGLPNDLAIELVSASAAEWSREEIASIVQEVRTSGSTIFPFDERGRAEDLGRKAVQDRKEREAERRRLERAARKAVNTKSTAELAMYVVRAVESKWKAWPPSARQVLFHAMNAPIAREGFCYGAIMRDAVALGSDGQRHSLSGVPGAFELLGDDDVPAFLGEDLLLAQRRETEEWREILVGARTVEASAIAESYDDTSREGRWRGEIFERDVLGLLETALRGRTDPTRLKAVVQKGVRGLLRDPDLVVQEVTAKIQEVWDSQHPEHAAWPSRWSSLVPPEHRDAAISHACRAAGVVNPPGGQAHLLPAPPWEIFGRPPVPRAFREDMIRKLAGAALAGGAGTLVSPNENYEEPPASWLETFNQWVFGDKVGATIKEFLAERESATNAEIFAHLEAQQLEVSNPRSVHQKIKRIAEASGYTKRNITDTDGVIHKTWIKRGAS